MREEIYKQEKEKKKEKLNKKDVRFRNVEWHSLQSRLLQISSNNITLTDCTRQLRGPSEISNISSLIFQSNNHIEKRWQNSRIECQNKEKLPSNIRQWAENIA